MPTHSSRLSSLFNPKSISALHLGVAVVVLTAGATVATDAGATAQVGDVFVIMMENHDLTQPSTYTSIQPLLSNSAAPYLNSLMTPGNPNAAQTSWASNLTNVGPHVHPSEPNYIWENGGSNFGVATDADPTAAHHNVITSPSLTGLLTQKGISWHDYQEDVQYSASPTGLTSASGTGGTAPSGVAVTTNPYNGSDQYNYAAKHNPAAFFTDSDTHPVSQLSQLTTDLANNTVGRYNLITPDQYNDMHTPLTGGFTYNGVHYTGDQAAVAEGDNFLSQIIPEIMASQAYQNNGMIEIWFDESEGGDTSQYTIPEIVISPLAVGNAFDVTEQLTHSADLLSMEELFQLNQCLGASCNSPDLSAFFVPGALPSTVPEPASLALIGSGLAGLGFVRRRRRG